MVDNRTLPQSTFTRNLSDSSSAMVEPAREDIPTGGEISTGIKAAEVGLKLFNASSSGSSKKKDPNEAYIASKFIQLKNEMGDLIEKTPDGSYIANEDRFLEVQSRVNSLKNKLMTHYQGAYADVIAKADTTVFGFDAFSKAEGILSEREDEAKKQQEAIEKNYDALATKYNISIPLDKDTGMKDYSGVEKFLIQIQNEVSTVELQNAIGKDEVLPQTEQASESFVNRGLGDPDIGLLFIQAGENTSEDTRQFINARDELIKGNKTTKNIQIVENYVRGYFVESLAQYKNPTVRQNRREYLEDKIGGFMSIVGLGFGEDNYKRYKEQMANRTDAEVAEKFQEIARAGAIIKATGADEQTQNSLWNNILPDMLSPDKAKSPMRRQMNAYIAGEEYRPDPDNPEESAKANAEAGSKVIKAFNKVNTPPSIYGITVNRFADSVKNPRDIVKATSVILSGNGVSHLKTLTQEERTKFLDNANKMSETLTDSISRLQLPSDSIKIKYDSKKNIFFAESNIKDNPNDYLASARSRGDLRDTEELLNYINSKLIIDASISSLTDSELNFSEIVSMLGAEEGTLRQFKAGEDVSGTNYQYVPNQEVINTLVGTKIKEVMPKEFSTLPDLQPQGGGMFVEPQEPVSGSAGAMFNPDGTPDVLGNLIMELQNQGVGITDEDRQAFNNLIGTIVERDENNVVREVVEIEEGARNKVYNDTRGFKTIGIGFNMDKSGAKKIWDSLDLSVSFNDAKNGAKISDDDVSKLFNVEIKEAKEVAKGIISNYDSLSENRKSVIASMVYQLGPTGFKKFKNTIAAIEAGDFDKAAEEMLDSQWFKQTPARALRASQMLKNDVNIREAEASLGDAIKPNQKKFS